MTHNATFLYCNHCRTEINKNPKYLPKMKKEHIAALVLYYKSNGDSHLIDANGNFIPQRNPK